MAKYKAKVDTVFNFTFIRAGKIIVAGEELRNSPNFECLDGSSKKRQARVQRPAETLNMQKHCSAAKNWESLCITESRKRICLPLLQRQKQNVLLPKAGTIKAMQVLATAVPAKLTIKIPEKPKITKTTAIMPAEKISGTPVINKYQREAKASLFYLRS